MHAFLTVRKLRSGSYEEWRRAWEPDEWPEGAQKAYILRNVDDPGEVITFGFFEMLLDDRDAQARLAQPSGRHLAGRPCTDHNHIEFFAHRTRLPSGSEIRHRPLDPAAFAEIQPPAKDPDM